MATVQQWSAEHVALSVVATLSIAAARWLGDDSPTAPGTSLAIVVGAFRGEHVIPRPGADPLPAVGRAVRR